MQYFTFPCSTPGCESVVERVHPPNVTQHYRCFNCKKKKVQAYQLDYQRTRRAKLQRIRDTI